jgi:hypothetical protein
MRCGNAHGAYTCRIGDVGELGELMLAEDPERADERNSHYPASSGAFRMPPGERYGDAWHCVGAGSHLRRTTDFRYFYVHLQDITVLPPCEPGEGSASFEWSSGQSGVDVASSAGELVSVRAYFDQRCSENMCKFSFRNSNSAARTSTHLYITLDGTIEGDLVELPVREAAWFTVPATGVPVRRACSTSGTLHLDRQGTSRVQLDAISAFVPCPGAPVDQAVFDLIGG